MFNILRPLLFLISLLFSWGTVFAIEMPFTDVGPNDVYYSSVQELYEWKVISDSGDHLFRPADLMSRDFFVSLAVGIGCHRCETASMEDIITYRVSPFVDLQKTNQFYYCIAYAKDANISQWYTPDKSGKATCENSQQYMSSPFCAENTISRIEAAAILLRRAKLWDDTLNSGNFDKSIVIPDATSYWYGYAKKGIDMGIITPKSDGSIGQDEKISRWEFAIMAARILQYTQCQSDNTTNTIEAGIGVTNKAQEFIQKSSFAKWEDFSLVPLTSGGNWKYNWIARNPNTGESITMSGDVLPGSKLAEGTWIVTLQVIDAVTNAIVSEPSTTIAIWKSNDYTWNIGIRNKAGAISTKNIFNITDPIILFSTHTGWPWDQVWKAIDKNTGAVVTGSWKELPGSKLTEGSWTVTLTTRDPTTGTTVDTDTRNIQIIFGDRTLALNPNNLTVLLQADPLVSQLWGIIHLTSTSNATGWLLYKWDFWDGTTTRGSGSSNHVYREWWVYTVILTVIDPKTWDTSQSSVIIRISGERDTDTDGVPDPLDQCPLIFSKTITGCPLFSTYTDQTRDIQILSTPPYSIEAAIAIQNGSGVITTKNNFPKWEDFSLIAKTGSGTWNYSWHATNPVTGQMISGTGLTFPGSRFGTGDWKVILDIMSPSSWRIIASPAITIQIHDPSTGIDDRVPCVSILASPMNTTIHSPIVLDATVCTSNNPLTYQWNYGDDTTYNGSGSMNHIYTTPGIYTIILQVTDTKTGKTGESTVIVRISGSDTNNSSTGTPYNNSDNICLAGRQKSQWLLTGSPNCTQCPCTNSISIDAPLRSCDVVFPTIMSPMLDIIYARGWFYLIP